MKSTIIILAITLLPLFSWATDRPDSFMCYLDRKIDTPTDSPVIKHPWKERKILIVFDYESKTVKVYARETLSITINQVSPHYFTEGGDRAIDMQGVDHLGRMVVVTAVVRVGEEQISWILVSYLNATLQYQVRSVKSIVAR